MSFPVYTVGCAKCGEGHVYTNYTLAEHKLESMREGGPFGEGEHEHSHYGLGIVRLDSERVPLFENTDPSWVYGGVDQ